MSAFAAEAAVRLKFQILDTNTVPSALIEGSITDAHTELLRHLDPAYNMPVAPAGLVLGEVLLAGAHVFRALGAREALGQRKTSIGGQVIDAEKRFSSLLAYADRVEDQAWEVLAPYLTPVVGAGVIKVTESTPVLGEEE